MAVLRMCLFMAAAAGAFLLSAGPAVADWTPADGHKMHFPQLPDVNGWDVNATGPIVLADDWTCTATGPVKDIHFWGSWKNGVVGKIAGFHLSIHSDIPADPGVPQSFSKPGASIWDRDIPEPGVVQIDPPAMEGWYDPSTGEVIEEDHSSYFQYNVTLAPPDWFMQTQGTVYWLDISANVSDGVWGWKTADVSTYPAPYTNNHYLDDAVWGMGANPVWQELTDPLDPHPSLDLAFVITPEPSTAAMLLCGGLAGLLAYAWRRWRRM